MNLITSTVNHMAFILAGNSTFTVVNEKSERLTYKVTAPSLKNGTTKRDYAANVRFVSVMTGPDNEKSYTFIGTIFINDKVFRYSPKSKLNRDALSVEAFDFIFYQIAHEGLEERLTFHHEGKCARCGRKLTVPESIKSGFGPECESIVGGV